MVFSCTSLAGVLQFTISSVPSGCGSVIMSKYHLEPSLECVFKEICKMYAENGAGTIFTTLGETFIEKMNILKKWGFTVLSTYTNKRHGSSKQSLLQLIT